MVQLKSVWHVPLKPQYTYDINQNPKLKCQEEGKQLVGAGQMKDRNSSNLSVELDDNQGAMEAAQSGSES